MEKPIKNNIVNLCIDGVAEKSIVSSIYKIVKVQIKELFTNSNIEHFGKKKKKKEKKKRDKQLNKIDGGDGKKKRQKKKKKEKKEEKKAAEEAVRVAEENRIAQEEADDEAAEEAIRTAEAAARIAEADNERLAEEKEAEITRLVDLGKRVEAGTLTDEDNVALSEAMAKSKELSESLEEAKKESDGLSESLEEANAKLAQLLIDEKQYKIDMAKTNEDNLQENETKQKQEISDINEKLEDMKESKSDEISDIKKKLEDMKESKSDEISKINEKLKEMKETNDKELSEALKESNKLTISLNKANSKIDKLLQKEKDYLKQHEENITSINDDNTAEQKNTLSNFEQKIKINAEANAVALSKALDKSNKLTISLNKANSKIEQLLQNEKQYKIDMNTVNGSTEQQKALFNIRDELKIMSASNKTLKEKIKSQQIFIDNFNANILKNQRESRMNGNTNTDNVSMGENTNTDNVYMGGNTNTDNVSMGGNNVPIYGNNVPVYRTMQNLIINNNKLSFSEQQHENARLYNTVRTLRNTKQPCYVINNSNIANQKIQLHRILYILDVIENERGNNKQSNYPYSYNAQPTNDFNTQCQKMSIYS